MNRRYLMKSSIFSFIIIAMCATLVYANDIEIIELKSVATPQQQQKAIPEPTSQEMEKARRSAEGLIANSLRKLQQLENTPSLTKNLREARAILIFPQVLKFALYIGASRGKGVLLARSKTGEWSYPTFYTLTQASAGLQFGINSSAIIMEVMTGKGLGALVRDNFKIGGDLTTTLGAEGEGRGLATTSNFRQDIKTYILSEGAFIGVSLNGAGISPDTLLNQAYYGQPEANTQTVIVQGQYSNTQANALRKYLSQFTYLYN